MPGSDPPPSSATSKLGEWTRAALALVLVVGGLLIILFMWYNPAASAPPVSGQPPPPYKDPQVVITSLIALIGTVAGYYFGTRGTEKALEEAAQANREKAGAAVEYEALLAPRALEEDASLEQRLHAIRRRYRI